MEEYELSHQTPEFYARRNLDFLFDWKPDIERFEREVAEAKMRGVGDGLSLGEMECSLDLLDAELLALRGRNCDRATQREVSQLVDLRGKLVRLIDQLRPLIGIVLR